MNPTFALLTLLLALAVVATPAQAIDRQDVCDVPQTCDAPAVHGCQNMSVGVLPPDFDMDENCLDVLPPPSGPEGASASESEGADDGDCMLLTVSASVAYDLHEGCTLSGLWEIVAEASV